MHDDLAIFRTTIVLSCALIMITAIAEAQSVSPPAPTPFPPPQLEMRVPFEPTAFPNAGRTYLTYELHLRNFAPIPSVIRRVEVLDTTGTSARPIAAFQDAQLDNIVQPVGGSRDTNPDRREIAAGRSVVLFIWIVSDGGVPLPSRLRHRVVTSNAAIEGAEIGTHHTELSVLGPPLNGSDWVARSGPSNDSYHRRGILVFDGTATIDRRYAIDWVRIRNGATFSGDEHDNRSYYAYGEVVLAVADGKVVSAKDGIPENVPAHEGFRPAVPLTMESLAGNTITLDIGVGQFAYYMHLQPGSVSVKVGDRVRRGDVLARIGNSGDAREPHLHFEVTNSPRLLLGEGVPYLIQQYRVKSTNDSWQIRTRELPLTDMTVDFGRPEVRHR